MDLFWVMKDGKWGVIDHNNEIIIPFIYDEFINKYKPVKGGKIGLIWFENSIPTMRFECQYDYLKYDRHIAVRTGWVFSIYKVKRDGKWGYVGENSVEFFRN